VSRPADPTPAVVLPSWAIVGDKRRAHIARVTALLDGWAAGLGLAPADAQAWHDAGRWHDALRDADEPTLRELTRDRDTPPDLLHGPAAAERLAAEGETRRSVLDAVRWHTVGHPAWDRTGRALYMADFLDPGRKFMATDRAFLAAHVPRDFDAVFRQVVRMRIEWLLREGRGIYHHTTDLWNLVRQ
jgi:HD superfamily phosphohydrolase YqeK